MSLQRPRLLLLLLIGAGFALRLYNLGGQSLWYDETVSAFLARQPVLDLIAHTARDIHPPGYYLLLRGWVQLVGHTEFALAFFSLGWGVVLIALSYRLARLVLGPGVARWTAALVAISPYNIWYSQEVRMYTLGAALGVLAAYFLLRASTSAASAAPAARRRFWIGYALVAAAGLYALYYFAFLLIALNLFTGVYLLSQRASRRDVLPWALAQFAVVVLYVPWLPTAWRQATNPPVPPWRSFIPPGRVLVESWTALSLGESVQPGQVWPILLIFLTLFATGILATRRLRLAAANPGLRLPLWPLLVLYTFGSLLLIYGLSVLTPLYHVRYVFTFSPAFYILVAAGLVWMLARARLVAVAFSLAILAGAIFSLRELHANPRYAADDFRAAVQLIEGRWQPGDVILVNAGYAYTALDYYFNGPLAGRLRLTDFSPAEGRMQAPLVLQAGTVNGPPTLGFGDPAADFYPMSEAQTIAALEAVAEHYHRIWLLRAYDTVTDPNGIIRAWLREESARQFEDQVFTGTSNIRVQGFLTRASSTPSVTDEIPFENGLQLAGYTPPPAQGEPGQPLRVVLWWLPTAPLETDYAVSLKLWNAADELAAQADEWPLGNLYFTSAWEPGQVVRHPMRLALPADLPVGRYRLDAEIYNPATVRPLERLDGKGHVVTLGEVTVQD
ncbi:MAG: glycosyltransferase family 39 protein [Anaerolineae bacterium]